MYEDTDQQIWERACERVGVWKRGQKRHAERKPVNCKTHEVGNTYCAECLPSPLIVEISAPPIGDPDATLVMLTLCVAYETTMIQHLRSDGSFAVHTNDLAIAKTIPLALAAAVCARG
jgi:hypothetical protein